MTTEGIRAGLNPVQAEAVDAVRGPVAILAGAGSGKTTTITRRIANQVASGTFTADQLLAVTFTNRAAGGLVRRLASLGVEGVNARTFHSAALKQLHFFSEEPPPRILSSKGALLYRITRSLPKPYRFTPTADVAHEIEWAKNRRVTAARYLETLGSHEPPLPADLMERIFQRYEDAKQREGVMDFEDVLERTVTLFEHDDGYTGERFRSRYKAFTVDEYQDVNLLQQTLLDLWLGGTDELCVVGDDYQSIYSFTGADARFLLEMPARYPGCRVFRLERNYRSTPEILGLANRLVPKLGGAEKVLESVAEPGEAPVRRGFASSEAERRALVERIEELHREHDVAYEEMAILYRINAASEDYEDALSAAGIPYQVRGGSFLARPAARSILPALKRSRARSDCAEVMRAAAAKAGHDPEADPSGTEEITRKRDFERFIALAVEFEDGTRTVAELIEDLGTRFGANADGRGVNLLTLHRAKGLEWDAVFLPALEDGELPFRRAIDTALDEERRLFYVGMTRARRFLSVTWSRGGRRQASRFIGEISPGEVGRTAPRVDAREGSAGDEPPELVAALKRWRLERSRADDVPAYVVMPDTTLQDIARRSPKNGSDLLEVSGMGPARCERYGADILQVVSSFD